MEIREMEFCDLEEVAELEREIFSMPWSRQGFLEALQTGNAVFKVAVEAGHIAGYCGMYVAADEGEITNVAVNPAYRRRGTGTALLQELTWEAGKRGLAHIILEVRKSNREAIDVYRRNGYEEIGERRNFYQRPQEDALVMCLELS